jgi:hypothetical protein
MEGSTLLVLYRVAVPLVMALCRFGDGDGGVCGRVHIVYLYMHREQWALCVRFKATQ